MFYTVRKEKMKHKINILIIILVTIGIMGLVFLSFSPYYEPATRQYSFYVNNKVDDTIRIAFIGDSWAFLHKRHNCQIANTISSRTGKPACIRSVGVNGMTSKEIYYSIFNNDSVRNVINWGPNFCIISAGINDTDLKLGEKFYITNMQLILQFMADNDIIPIVMEIPHYDIEYSFDRRYKRQKLFRIISMIITCSRINCIDSYREAFLQFIKSNEKKYNMHYLLSSKWNPDGYKDPRNIYTSDMMHINEHGYLILDSCIIEEILNSLRKPLH